MCYPWYAFYITVKKENKDTYLIFSIFENLHIMHFQSYFLLFLLFVLLKQKKCHDLNINFNSITIVIKNLYLTSSYGRIRFHEISVKVEDKFQQVC